MLPVGDGAFGGVEGDADEHDAPGVGEVGCVVAAVADLGEGGGVAVELELEDVDPVARLADGVGAGAAGALLGGDVGADEAEDGEDDVVEVVLGLEVEVVGDAGETATQTRRTTKYMPATTSLMRSA